MLLTESLDFLSANPYFTIINRGEVFRRWGNTQFITPLVPTA